MFLLVPIYWKEVKVFTGAYIYRKLKYLLVPIYWKEVIIEV